MSSKNVNDHRIQQILDLILKLAAGDLDARSPIIGDGNEFDAIISGLNMLAEELGHTTDELVAARNFLENIFSSMENLLITTNHCGDISIVNQSTLELLGYEAEEMDKKPIKEIIYDRDQIPIFNTGHTLSTKTERQKAIEAAYLTKNGTLIPVMLSRSTITGKEDKLEGFVFVAQDIRERKKAEKEITRLVQLIENSRDFIGLSTLAGDVIYLNRAGLNMVGLNTIDQATNKQIFDFVPEYLVNNINEEALPAVMANKHWTNQVEFRKFDTGELFPIEINVFAVSQTKSDPISNIAIVGRDITERKIMEAQMLHSQKLESLGTLAGGIAHDFNNILSAIIGYADILDDVLPDESDEKSYLQEIIKAGDRGTDLTKQILTFSRAEAEKLEPIDIAAITMEAINMMRATLPATIEIKSEIQPNCGYIMGVPIQIHQIVVNLCTNAGHAMKENGGLLEIKLMELSEAECRTSKIDPSGAGYLGLIVKDNGTGMTDEVKERIFEPFFTTKEIGEGTGLGLSTVHGIVKNHKGFIEIKSSLGAGTIFQILFPIVRSQHQEKTIEKTVFQESNGRILLAEDEPSLLNYYTIALEQLGYVVSKTSNGASALELFRQRPDQFDLVLVDQAMPKMTGTELSREIRLIDPDIPIVLTSGYLDAVSEKECIEFGITETLGKPVRTSQLAELMRRVLNCTDGQAGKLGDK